VSITCGIDWAEAHHDVAVLDDSGRVLERRRIDTGVPGFGQLMAMLQDHAEDPTKVRSRSRPTRTSSSWRCKPLA